ncbi:MAG TPA: aldo/keto reductase [Candidatus Binataceae bacterium]|nr:aldo/keto reductase [Candidatus Binataceae bacterium]
MIELKELGKTGVKVPEIGVGVWRYSGGVEPLRKAIELGAWLIDTAEVYGTEAVVGQAIDGLRERVFVATKVAGQHLRHDEVLRAAEASLKRLAIDRIDLYQIHWPNGAVPIAETMRAMETLVDRDQVRYIGVSNFSLAQLRGAQAAMSKYPIVANQVLYNLNRREIEAELIPYCEANGVTVIAFTPLDSGNLARHSQYPRNPEGQQALERIATETGKTASQVALNWCVRSPSVITIPKSNQTARVAENCGGSGWRLSTGQIELLNRAFPLPDPDGEF